MSLSMRDYLRNKSQFLQKLATSLDDIAFQAVLKNDNLDEDNKIELLEISILVEAKDPHITTSTSWSMQLDLPVK